MAELQRTTLNTTWLVKFVIFAIVCFVLGGWFLYDALLAYPQRGRADAEYQLKEYLDRVAERGETAANLTIPDPVSRLADLEARKDELTKAGAEASALSPQNPGDVSRYRALLPKLAEKEEFEWLSALKLVGSLTTEATRLTDWRAMHKQLKDQWSTRDAPKPLSAFDIPSQWLLAAVCLPLALLLTVYILRSASRRYTYDPASRTLTLPGGRTITPEILEDIDKRRWDKFYVTVMTKDGAPPVQLDLLRYVNLEGWVLEIERIAFPDRAAAAPSPASDAGAEPPVT